MKKSAVIYQRKVTKKKSRRDNSGPLINFYPLSVGLLILFILINRIQVANSGLLPKNNLMAKLSGLSASPTLSPTPTYTPTPTPTPLILPSTLFIEKLGIETEIDFVGVVDGKMANPTSWDRVAWFAPSAPPGSVGNTVIAGHYDTDRGRPAVFYRLGSLEPGDIVKIYSSDGQEFNYRVTGKEVYPYDEAPLDFIFAGYDIPRLVLVTCEGQFFNSINTYSHRIVVYSELI